ncbi:MAG: hypothetical protein LLG20_15610 [Acidobacteriales bacterium]|nr:hypothetical protein [Terriglobales bacterium]
MARQMLMPKLNEAGSDCVVSEWMVAAGSTIHEDTPVVAMETDKVIVDVPSTVEGCVTRLLVASGETVRVGQPILEVE